MTRLLLTILILGSLAGIVPYMLLRRMGGVGRSVFAYCTGLLVSASTSFGVSLAMQAILPVSVLDADRVIGSGLACAVIGPVLGMLAAKRSRARLQRLGL